VSDEKKSPRQVHVEALKVELETLQRRPDSDTKTRRVGEVEAELRKFGRNPARGAQPEKA
jgi:hypothetical protein